MPSKRNNSIEDNGYALLPPAFPVHVGALVVYRKNGVIQHTGIVREVVLLDGTTHSREYCRIGKPNLVESKRGRLGQYEHPPEKVPTEGPDAYLPPDDPNTPEREGIQYYELPSPLPHKRQPPPGSIDPGKDQHTLWGGLE